MKYNTVLFDVDGTLCDPGKSMIECARYALSKFDINETNEENLRRLIGPPLEHAFRDYYGFDTAQATQAVVYFRDMMQREGVQLYEPYPGVTNLLEELHSAGVTLAVVTSKIEHIARETLEKTGLSKYFEVVSAQQPNVVVEKDVILAKALSDLNADNKASIVMVGDRRYDVEAAKAHGVDSIGVLWGYGTLDELQNEGATHVAQDATQLGQIILSD